MEQKDPEETEKIKKAYEALKLVRSEREKAQEEKYKSLNAKAM